MLLAEQFTAIASKNFARPAIRYLGKETNFSDLKIHISRLSYLYQHDLGHGARVAFLTRNSPAVFATFLALSNNRSITIPLDPEAEPAVLAGWLKETKATHVAVTSDLAGRAREILQQARLALPIVDIEKKQGGEYDKSFSPPPDNKPIDTDPVLLLRTGGTTGKPKFVTFTHRQLVHAASCARGPYHLFPSDRFLTTLNWQNPFAFVHGMLLPILSGMTCIVDHGLEGAGFLEFVIESRATRLVGTPPFFLKLLVTCKNEKKLLTGIRSVVVGSGFLLPEVRKAFGALKIPVQQCYGLTEAVWTLALEDTEKPGTERNFVGRGLVGMKYRVLDSNGDEIPGKEKRTGLLAVMGPLVMHSYYDREKETKLAIRGTWLHTGDIVTLEDEGEDLKITLIGRKEDVILIAGQPIPIPGIDATLKKIAGVHDAASFAARNAKGEQVLLCAVVKVQGSALTEKQVLDHCMGFYPSAQCPKTVVFTDSIPRDPLGNLAYVRLRAQFSALAG